MGETLRRQSRFAVEEIVRIIAESELPTSSIAGTAREYGIKEARLSRGRPEDQRLKERIRDLARAEAPFGYRRITAVLRRQGMLCVP